MVQSAKYPVVLSVMVFGLLFDVTDADNFTSRYVRMGPQPGGPKHQPRFLTFNTQDDGDLTVDLEFAVPFITIPVKKTVNGAMGLYNGGLANINIGALIVAGGMVFGAVVAVPFISSFFFKHVMANPLYRNTEQPNDSWRIMALIDQALIENNIDTTSCMQRTMCWLAKTSRAKLAAGQATSQDKIIDGLMTNYWVNQMIQGSAMQTAIQTGLDNQNCSEQYRNCKITQKSIQAFANKFTSYLQAKK